MFRSRVLHLGFRAWGLRVEFDLCLVSYLGGSYPTPFLGYRVLWLGSAILESRRPKKGVGYEPLGSYKLLRF